MTEQSYHLKIRGRTLGPFSADRIRQMAAEGSLNRMHQISIDGQNWLSVSEFPQLFAQQGTPHAVPGIHNNRMQSIQPTTNPSTPNLIDIASNQPLETGDGDPLGMEGAYLKETLEPVWYYGINDQSTGPVSQKMIEELIVSGQLAPTDVLWRSGKKDWEPVQNFSEFARVLSRENIRQGFQHETKMGAGGNQHASSSTTIGIDRSDPISQHIRDSKTWVYACFISLYFLAAAGVLGSIYLLIVGIKGASIPGVLGSLGSFVLMTFLGFIAFLLNRYAFSIARYESTLKPASLHDAMKHLSWFWIFLAIWLMLCFASTIVVSMFYFVSAENY